MARLSRKEYFPWHREGSEKRPHERYLHEDFLKSEIKRIKETKEWFKEYRSLEVGDTVDELIAYSLPHDIAKSLNKEVQGHGYRVKGISALKNNVQNPLLGLFPKGTKIPPDYSLVRFVDAKKQAVPQVNSVQAFPAIIVKDFEVLPDEYLYVDVPTEKRLTLDLLEENLGGDRFVAESLKAPLLSSPPISSGEGGGIGTSSITKKSKYAEGMLDIGRQMLPPELTDVKPPETDSKGTSERLGYGHGGMLKFKAAEKTYRTSSHVGLGKGNSYKLIQSERERRSGFNGEYSFFGSIVPTGGKEVNVFHEALERFTQTDITTSSFDQLRKADVDLGSIKEEIHGNEDYWINFVEARQIYPSTESVDVDKWRNNLEEEWDVYLPRMGIDDDLEVVKEVRAEKSVENLLRIAQSMARSERRSQVTESDLKGAYVNIKTQIEKFIDHDVTKDAKSKLERRPHTSREETLKNIMKSRPSTVDSIWNVLEGTGRFQSKENLQNFLDRLHRNGIIYRKPDGTFDWA